MTCVLRLAGPSRHLRPTSASSFLLTGEACARSSVSSVSSHGRASRQTVSSPLLRSYSHQRALPLSAKHRIADADADALTSSFSRSLTKPSRAISPALISARFHSHASTTNLASSAYDASSPRTEATASTPANLTPTQRLLLEEIIRVDQAGESAANWIYESTAGAVALKGDKRTAKDVEEMWSTERHHLSTLNSLAAQHRVRPTALAPVWQGLSYVLGGVTGIMSREAIMAATEAVETVIGEHYDDQIKELADVLEEHTKAGSPPHPSLPLLHRILQEFRDDELEHLDTAVENGAQMAPGHALLSSVVGAGCRGAIWMAAKV